MKEKLITAAAAAWLVLAAGVQAAQLDAKMNYETYNAELTYTSELNYPAYVTVVMTKADVGKPEISDYLQIGEALCPAKGTAQVSMKVDKNFDGVAEYKFFAVAGGVSGSGSEAAATLQIMSSGSVADVIKKINETGQNGISVVIYDELKDVLKLEGNASAQRDSYIYSIRQTDCGGSFISLNQIRDSWQTSDTLMSLADVKADEIPAMLEKYKDMLKLNLDDEDYAKQTEEACRILKAMASEGKITSLSTLQQQYNEAIAVAMINKSSVKEKDSYFEKYKQILGIEQLMQAYKSLDALKFARQFDGLTLNSAQEVYSRFDSTIKALSAGQTGTSGGGGGSGSNGFSLSGSPTVSISEASAVEEVEFTDLDSSHWAYEAVRALKNINVISGYSDGSFMPEKEVTREEFVTMIVLAFGFEEKPSAPEFTDVSETDWFGGYVASAASNGIISGMGDGSFGAGKSITRQEAAVILNSILTALGISQNDTASAPDFADAEQIAAWAAESAARLSGNGIISGIDGNFAPDLSVTRAQAARLIYGCMQYISRGGIK